MNNSKAILSDRLKDHWLIVIVTISATVSGTTWLVCDQLLVRPEAERIDYLTQRNSDLDNDLRDAKNEIERLKNENQQYQDQIAKSTKIIENLNKVVSPATGSASSDETVVDFPWVDTRSAPGYTVAAAPYLHGVGISITDIAPPTSRLVLINNMALYGGGALVPSTSQNFLTQIDTGNGPTSFTLKFFKPCRKVSFTRPALYASTSSGVTFPAWTAQALDAHGQELSSQSEGLIRSFKDVSAQTYVLETPNLEDIVFIRFNSDYRLNGVPFAGFAAILVERLTVSGE